MNCRRLIALFSGFSAIFCTVTFMFIMHLTDHIGIVKTYIGFASFVLTIAGVVAVALVYARESDARMRERAKILEEEVAKRKLVEQILREKEDNLRITLNSIGDAVIVTDFSGNLRQMNPAAERLVGCNFLAVIDKPFDTTLRLMNMVTRAPIVNPVGKILADHSVYLAESEAILHPGDGSPERLVSFSGAPVLSDLDVAVGVVFIMRDITEQYSLEEQLHHAQKLESVGQLAGGIAQGVQHHRALFRTLLS